MPSAKLLSTPGIFLGEEKVEVPRGKTSALLYYLAYQHDWVSREDILYLFWPDTEELKARNNLRQLLSAVRKLPFTDDLETNDQHLRWRIASDAQVFKEAVAQKQWAKAVETYHGPLLEGLQAHRFPEFESWLELERADLLRIFKDAALHLSQDFTTSERYKEGAEVLQKVLKQDPFDEISFRAYLKAIFLSEGRDKAKRELESYRQTLGHELGAEPETATLKLLEELESLAQEGELDAQSVAISIKTLEAKPLHNLPFKLTPFVGRAKEKAELAQYLATPTCRLLTLLGAGGMGKTRLALAVAEDHLGSFEHGVWFVALDALENSDAMLYAIAEALNFRFYGQKEPKVQLLNYLSNKDMLLVLDNLEHLLSSIELVSDILSAAPKVKILATSREKLQLQAEHVFDLEGLAVPEGNNTEANSFASLQLFAERARHNRLEYVLEDNLQATTKICQLVGGMPLAIELAASWSRLLTPSEIAKELEQSLDLLSNSTRDLPERHHSMRSVFEASWQRLSDEEQKALRKLSVFQGGFDREAAREIAELDLPILSALLNKSFLWRDSLGRFSQHPLILQYSKKKAKDYPEERKQVEEKHGLYYLELVKERAPELRTQKGKEARILLDNELPNIHAAWDWTLREKRIEEIKYYARALGVSFEHHNDYEGMEMFKQAVVALDEANPEHQAALGYSLIHQARREFFLDHDAREITQHGLALLEPLKEYPGIVTGFITLGDLTFARGDLAEAKEIYTVALGLARTYGSPSEIGWVLNQVALIETQLSSFSEVSALMQTTQKELRELGDPLNLGFCLTSFGSYLVDDDQLEEGEKLLLEGLDLGQKTAIVPVPTLSALAGLAYKRGDFQKAETYAQEVYEIASKQGDEQFKTGSLAILSRVKLAQGHLAEAEQLLLKSLHLSWIVDMPLYVVNALVCLAELSMAQGQVKQAVTLLGFLSRYQTIWKRDRDEALKLLTKAKGKLSARTFTKAQEESKSLTLEGIVTGILEHGKGKQLSIDEAIELALSSSQTST